MFMLLLVSDRRESNPGHTHPMRAHYHYATVRTGISIHGMRCVCLGEGCISLRGSVICRPRSGEMNTNPLARAHHSAAVVMRGGGRVFPAGGVGGGAEWCTVYDTYTAQVPPLLFRWYC